MVPRLELGALLVLVLLSALPEVCSGISALVRRDEGDVDRLSTAAARRRGSPDDRRKTERENRGKHFYPIGEIGNQYRFGDDEVAPHPSPAGICTGEYVFTLGEAPEPISNFSLKFTDPKNVEDVVSQPSFDVTGKVNKLHLLSLIDTSLQETEGCASHDKYAICSGLQWCLGLADKECRDNCQVAWQKIPWVPTPKRLPDEHQIWKVEEVEEGSGKLVFHNLAGMGPTLGITCQGVPPTNCHPVTSLMTNWRQTWMFRFELNMRDEWA